MLIEEWYSGLFQAGSMINPAINLLSNPLCRPGVQIALLMGLLFDIPVVIWRQSDTNIRPLELTCTHRFKIPKYNNASYPFPYPCFHLLNWRRNFFSPLK
jgi:hypothetical protein